ncbi:MAG: hypothetical protein LH630_10850 [Actinomycetia bacterium]|nr:hypothetical protein [Actinomycetes bacterium]
MTGWEMALLLLVIPLLFVALYLRGLAARLDRLHLRVEASEAVLDARLERRAALTREVALEAGLDPVSAVLLLDAATAAQHAERSWPARTAAESTLSAALRAVFGDPDAVEEIAQDPGSRTMLTELAEVSNGVVLARRFANDAVRAALAVRRRAVVRVLRLPGHARWPQSRDLDDAPPDALAQFALDSA